jgi:hypothetical protein
MNMAAVSGASVGNELGAFIRDRSEARRLRAQGLPEPEQRIYLQSLGQNAPATPTLVAMILAFLAPRRRPLWAFMIAAVLAALVGNRFDRMLLRPACQEETTDVPQE